MRLAWVTKPMPAKWTKPNFPNTPLAKIAAAAHCSKVKPVMPPVFAPCLRASKSQDLAGAAPTLRKPKPLFLTQTGQRTRAAPGLDAQFCHGVPAKRPLFSDPPWTSTSPHSPRHCRPLPATLACLLRPRYKPAASRRFCKGKMCSSAHPQVRAKPSPTSYLCSRLPHRAPHTTPKGPNWPPRWCWCPPVNWPSRSAKYSKAWRSVCPMASK